MVSRLRIRAIAVMLAAFGLLAAALPSSDVAHAAAKGRQSASAAQGGGVDLPAPSQPARYFTINSVLAKLDRGIKPGEPMKLASISATDTMSDQPKIESELGFNDDMPSPEPFGLALFRAPEGTLWRKWRPILAAMNDESEEIARCNTDLSECSAHVARFARLARSVGVKQGLDRIREANQAVNGMVRYVSDYAQWGVADKWSAPLDTFAGARGDCEDYAIAKYALLRAAGTDAADLKIVLVRDRTVREDHAVLAVRHDGTWLILDNRHNRLVADGESTDLSPLFALNETGVSLFAAPYARLAPGLEESGIAPAAASWGGEAEALQTGSGELALAM